MLKNEEVDVGVLLIVEYEQLKEEQSQRISTRDNLIYATLVSIAGVGAAAYQTKADDLLLLIPPCCLVLGWTFLVNDEKVSAIGRYVRTELSPRLSALVNSPHPLFGWENAHRADRRRRSRKVIQLCVDLLMFCLPALIAIIVRITRGNSSILIIAVVTLEITLVLILAQQILVNADLRQDRSWSVADADVPPALHAPERRAGGLAG